MKNLEIYGTGKGVIYINDLDDDEAEKLQKYYESRQLMVRVLESDDTAWTIFLAICFFILLPALCYFVFYITGEFLYRGGGY